MTRFLFLLLAALPGPQEATPEPERRFPSLGRQAVRTVAFYPDGKRLLAGSGPAVVWNVETGKEQVRLAGLDDVRSWIVRLSSDGKIVAGISYEGFEIRTWKADSGVEIDRDACALVTDIAVSPDGARVAAGTSGVSIFDTRDLNEGCVKLPVDKMSAVLFSPDNETVVTAERTGQLRVWDRGTGKPTATIEPIDADASELAFSADGRLLAVAGRKEPGATVWEFGTRKNRGRIGQDLPEFIRLAFFRESRCLAAITSDGNVLLIETASGKIVRTLARDVEKPLCIAASPDGLRIAVGTVDGVLLWKLGSGKSDVALEGAWKRLRDPDASVAFSAVLDLEAAGPVAAEFLKDRLTACFTAKELAATLEELDDADAATRERAQEKLESELHDPALWKALEASASAEVRARVQEITKAQELLPLRSRETLRRVRAVAILERLHAKPELERLAVGSATALQTVEARNALDRLNRK